MRQYQGMSNIKVRKSLFDSYNQQRKARSNVRPSHNQNDANQALDQSSLLIKAKNQINIFNEFSRSDTQHQNEFKEEQDLNQNDSNDDLSKDFTLNNKIIESGRLMNVKPMPAPQVNTKFKFNKFANEFTRLKTERHLHKKFNKDLDEQVINTPSNLNQDLFKSKYSVNIQPDSKDLSQSQTQKSTNQQCLISNKRIFHIDHFIELPPKSLPLLNQNTGGRNILPYLNKSDILYLRQKEQNIKSIKRMIFTDRSRSPNKRTNLDPSLLNNSQNNNNNNTTGNNHTNPVSLKQTINQIDEVPQEDNLPSQLRSLSNSSKLQSIVKIRQSHQNLQGNLQRFSVYSVSKTSRRQAGTKTHENWTLKQRNGDGTQRQGQSVQSGIDGESVVDKSQERLVNIDKSTEKINSILGIERIEDSISGTLKAKKLLTKDDFRKYFDNLSGNLQKQLMDSKNYKMFYWAPDYSFCGFASQDQVEMTAQKWMKDKKLKISGRKITADRNHHEILQNVSHIPEIMKYLKNTRLEK